MIRTRYFGTNRRTLVETWVVAIAVVVIVCTATIFRATTIRIATHSMNRKACVASNLLNLKQNIRIISTFSYDASCEM